MVAVRDVAARLRALVENPREFILRLHIEDKSNQLRPIRNYLPEQEQWIQALLSGRFVLAVKPRQLGFSTIALAFLMWKVLNAALLHRQSRKVLSVVHEENALDRFQLMTEIMRDQLPPEIRPAYARKSRTRTELARRQDGRKVPGPLLARLLAGGRGQGRSWTYNDFHATEMAHWPSGSSAKKTDDGRSVDEEAFSSILATIHDPTTSIIVESTGNGPRGLFFELYQQAVTDPKWTFVFEKWTNVRGYREALTDAQARALERDLDAEEVKLRTKFGVDLEQLAWRRTRMRTFQMSTLTFRRQFPLTPLEPFLLDKFGWLDQEALLELLQFAVHPLSASTEALRVFRPWEPGRRYVIGGDCAGGVGRDEACGQVIRDDMVHVATWASNRADPRETALEFSRLSGMYGRALVCVELNNHGQDVVDECIRLGVPLWAPNPDPRLVNPPPPKPGFWSSGDGAGNSKRAAMVHLREVIREGWTIINDVATINQAQRLVEGHDGNVVAASGHDDRILAYMLALWAGRMFWSGAGPATLDPERERVARILQIHQHGGASWNRP